MKKVTAIKSDAAIQKPATSGTTTSETVMRILKTGTCPSCSGKSNLTYHIGCAVNGESNCTDESSIQFRVFSNTGNGFFSKEWIPLEVILQVLSKVPSDKPLISYVLYPLFRGKSINTPAFLLAAMKQEGLVQQSTEKRRCYELLDPTEFMAEIRKLMASPDTASNAAVKAKDKPMRSTTGKEAVPTKQDKSALPPKGKKQAESSPT